MPADAPLVVSDQAAMGAEVAADRLFFRIDAAVQQSFVHYALHRFLLYIWIRGQWDEWALPAPQRSGEGRNTPRKGPNDDPVP